MIKIILLSLTMMISTQVTGQSSGLSITGGLGTYDMSDFKYYHDVILDRMPVDVKAGKYFPAYTNFKINLLRKKSEKIRYGILYGYSTTGAHANYTDYSGYINFDQIVTAHQVGLNIYYSLVKVANIDISAYGDLKLSYINDEVNLLVKTNYYFNNSNIKFNAISPFAESGLEAIVNLKKASIGIEGGFLHDFSRVMDTDDALTADALVNMSATEEIQSGMSGLRVGLKAIFWLSQSP